MKRRKTVIGACLLLVTMSGSAGAQSIADAGGGHFSGGGGTVAYSVGQVAYQVAVGPGGLASQGVQQAYEIYVTGVGSGPSLSNISVYPNPTAGAIVIDRGADRSPVLCQLYDLQGRELAGETVSGTQQFSLAQWPEGMYILKVTSDKQVQTFKIFKR